MPSPLLPGTARAADLNPSLNLRAPALGALGLLPAGLMPEEVAQVMQEYLQWADGPPPWGRWFDKAESVTLAGAAARTPVTGFRIPDGFLGLLRFFANNTQSASDITSVTFALEVDGSPIVGYSSIVGRKAPAISAPDPLILPLMGGQRVIVVATNATAAAIQGVSARLKGWYWPRAAART